MNDAVVVTSRSFSSGQLDLVERLTQAGLRVARAPASHDFAALREPLADAVGWIAGTGPITAEHFRLAPSLRVIARYGVGVDAVDLAAAAAAGVAVTNTPGANSDAVAEHSIALLMATLRSVPAGDRRVRAGDWSASRGRQLTGSVAGVVGFGRIGRATARRLKALGCTVIVHDPYVPDDQVLAAGHEPATVAQIRGCADVVSLHLPGGEQLVDSDWLATCATGQVIINTARSDLVDELAVVEALRDGRLSAFAADTLASERERHAASPLLAEDLDDRVVLTPHVGSQTVEAIDLMGSLAVDGLLAILAGRPPAHPVTPLAEAIT